MIEAPNKYIYTCICNYFFKKLDSGSRVIYIIGIGNIAKYIRTAIIKGKAQFYS